VVTAPRAYASSSSCRKSVGGRPVPRSHSSPFFSSL
jgi:hypothetical protein